MENIVLLFRIELKIKLKVINREEIDFKPDFVRISGPLLI